MKDKDLDRLRREAFGFVFQQATFLKISYPRQYLPTEYYW